MSLVFRSWIVNDGSKKTDSDCAIAHKVHWNLFYNDKEKWHFAGRQFILIDSCLK